ncbi:unnamed protein product [Pelagomonas calceolata]|uniref:Uncharacterized protein n=2 Tax=Pelagomonas calceolata TaxID=35677 RepID=A0A8J2X1W9_9STRA|nr:unnamed protein product [Pelagomonas calceolata]
MDFLDYEEETEINESDSPHQSITKLLDNRELLQELRATPSIAEFLKTNASLVLQAALTKDGEVDDDDDTVDQKQRYTPADRRAYVASEVLCGPDVACVAILKACADSEECWALLEDPSPVSTMRDARWARIWLRLLEVARYDTIKHAPPLSRFAAAVSKNSTSAADVAGALLKDACRRDRAVKVAWNDLRSICAALDVGASAQLLLNALPGCASKIVDDQRCLASVARARSTKALLVMAEILSEAASGDFENRPALAKALAPHSTRIAKQLSQGARLEKVAAAQLLRGLARCPDANSALCDACLDACADSLFTHPHADVLHVHSADVLLAIIDRKPLHAHAAKRLERLLFRDNSTEGGLLSRIRSTLTGLERPKNSRDAHLVVLGEAVCAALREDEAKPGAGLVPDLLYARRNELDAWLHFVEDLARLTARKVAADFAVPVVNGGGWDDVNAG